jgi:hypothetical protein
VKVYSTRAVPGLPGPLPAGESLLWQGAPDWRVLATRAFHIRAVAIYFAAILAIRGGLVVADGGGVTDAIVSALTIAPLGLAAMALIALYAWGVQKTTVYTITDRRIVLKIGIALPVTINLPFRIVGSADLRHHGGGAGDIAIALSEGRMGFAHLWPHARPFRLRAPEPMLRGLADVTRPGTILADALAAAAGIQPVRVQSEDAESRAQVRLPEAAAA